MTRIGRQQQHILERVRQYPGESMNFVIRPARWRHSAQQSVRALERRGLLFIDHSFGSQGWALYASEADRRRGRAAKENAEALARLQRQAEREPDLLQRMALIEAMGPLIRAQIEQFAERWQ